MSAQATAAPSRAASTAMARPLPIGASGSAEARVPAPTTRMRRPARRASRASRLGQARRRRPRAARPRLLSVKATRWYWPTTMQISMSCARSQRPARLAQVSSPMWASAWSSSAAAQRARRRRPTTPGRRRPAGGDGGDLVGGEAGVEADAHVLAPLVVGLAVPRRAQDEQLALPGRQLAAGRGACRRRPTTASAAGGGGRGWRRCSGRCRRRRRWGPAATASNSAVRSSRSSGASGAMRRGCSAMAAILPVGARA